MSDVNSILIFIVVFLAGGLIGFIICNMTIGKKKASVQQQELEQNKAELEQYKAKVNNHFTDSADLMGQVASSYQALYSHMASQSQSLLSDQEDCPFPLLNTASDANNEFNIETKDDEIEEPIIINHDISVSEMLNDNNESQDTDEQTPVSSDNTTDTDEEKHEQEQDKSSEETVPTSENDIKK